MRPHTGTFIATCGPTPTGLGRRVCARDTGIDLVAKTDGTGEYHAIQCKLYAEDYRIQKKDIDSFFTASGRKPFTHRIIVSTTTNWSEHAEDALRDQQPPVSKIDLHDLENSQIDWSRYKPKSDPVLKPKKFLRPQQDAAVKAVLAGLKQANRGKPIMACGTGKTFASLKIAEAQAVRAGAFSSSYRASHCCRRLSRNGHRRV